MKHLLRQLPPVHELQKNEQFLKLSLNMISINIT